MNVMALTEPTVLVVILTAISGAVAALYRWNTRLQNQITALRVSEQNNLNQITKLKTTLRSLRTYVKMVQSSQRSSEKYITRLTGLLRRNRISIPTRPAARDYTADLLSVLAGLDDSGADVIDEIDETDEATSDDDADTGEEDQ